MTFFSVVIPVKDRSNLLRRALISLQKQTHKNFEVIVIDDGSAENISKAVSDFTDLKIKLIKQAKDKSGAAAARNLGCAHSQGSYIAFLDSDDIFLPNKLKRVSEEIGETSSELLASYLLVYRGTDRLQLRPTRPLSPQERVDEFYFVADQRIQSSSIIVSKRVADATPWNEKLRKVQDPDFFIRAAKLAETVKFISEPLAILFDDELDGRISSNPVEGNMKEWLASDACPLGERARKGFIHYALSYEVAKRSKIEAFKLAIFNADAVSKKTLLKTTYRLSVSEKIFKKTAKLLSGPQKNEYRHAHSFIVSITSEV